MNSFKQVNKFKIKADVFYLDPDRDCLVEPTLLINASVTILYLYCILNFELLCNEICNMTFVFFPTYNFLHTYSIRLKGSLFTHPAVYCV